MSDGAAFALDVTRFVEKTNAKLNLVVRKVLFDLSARIVQLSPVDTGRFRANWQYGEGQIPSGTVDAVDKSSDGGSTAADIMQKIPQQAMGKIHYVVNNLPYSIRLEYGWSKQAPSGMVRITLQEYSTVFNKVVNELA